MRRSHQCLLVAAAVAVCPLMLRAEDATWIGASGGSWNGASNWSGGVLPHNSGSTSFNVFIDAGNPAANTVHVANGSLRP
jgi:hypothetical protein